MRAYVCVWGGGREGGRDKYLITVINHISFFGLQDSMS